MTGFGAGRPREMLMEIKQETRVGWLIVTPVGRADASSADSLEMVLVTAAQTNEKIAVDLTGLSYVSSAGLRAILQGARSAQQRKAEFVLCCPTPNVKSVFDISGIQQVVRVEGVLPC